MTGEVGDITAAGLVLAGKIATIRLGMHWQAGVGWQVEEEIIRQVLGTDGLVFGHGQCNAQHAGELT